MSGRRRSSVAMLALLAATVLAACGDLESGGGGGDESRGELTDGTTTTPTRPARDLPPRPDGVVQIEGQVNGSITDEVVARFPDYTARSGLAVRAVATDTDEEPGFAALCEGRIDIAAASRRITEAELEACRQNGLAVIDFQVAFDAIVIVTRNERDVGADCVNLAQLRSMFAAGTPVDSWNQVNPSFSILALEPAGPDESTSDFDFFGARVLGVPDPTLANFRADYRALARERQVKNFVADSPPGAVGIIGFSFYELYEEKLRPLEIDGQTGDRCVFPSEETISSELYPLERTLRLYTTARSLGRPEVQAYLRFHLDKAEAIAGRLELIPLPDLLRESELAKLRDPDANGTEPTAEETGDSEAETTGTTTVPEGG